MFEGENRVFKNTGVEYDFYRNSRRKEANKQVSGAGAVTGPLDNEVGSEHERKDNERT